MTSDAPGISPVLVEAAVEGDRASLRRLVELAYPLVHRWALVKMGEPADADDLTQDVLVLMIRRIGTFQGNARFESWLFSMTRNAALDRLRKSARRRELGQDPKAWRDVAPAEAPSPDASVERSEMIALLTSLFRELPDRQREVFDLVELQGRSATEAAEIMGVEPVSVRAHLFKARRRLRTRILAERPELVGDFS